MDEETKTVDPTAATAPDFSKFEESLLSKLDSRFGGIQSLVDKKVGKLAQELEQLKTANLSPEEQEQLETSKEAQRIEALERENALLKLRKQYPEEVDFLEQFFGQSSLEDQIALMSSFRAKAPAVESPADEIEEEPTPVEGNNPARRTKPDVLGDDEMTEERANMILSASDQPGMLRKVRDMLSGNK